MKYLKPLILYKEVIKREQHSVRFPSLIALNFREDRVTLAYWSPVYSEPCILGFGSCDMSILSNDILTRTNNETGLVFSYPISNTNEAKMEMFINKLDTVRSFKDLMYTFWDPRLILKKKKYDDLYDPNEMIPPSPEESSSACELLEGYLKCARMCIETPTIVEECG
ncbi:hypothetical protein Q3G72_033073 [Acer saccharum]|nr:hypothetical protein Q3G72_033073 [Acer saccharum]